MLRLLLCTLLALPSLASAQSHPLIGTWNISVETLMPPGSGGPSLINRKGVLSVALTGDSLIATLTLEPVKGIPASPPERLAARQRTGPVSFVKAANASLSGDHDQLSRSSSITYTFDVRDGQLTGSQNIQVEGISGIPPRAISGTRAP